MPDANLSIHYRTKAIDGLEIFYREAGPSDAPTVLLLHGFPTSSHMFRDLLPALADSYHLIAPDYPGFGFSATPSPAEFDYTFDNVAAIMGRFLDEIGVQRFSLYAQDFGGPVGFRIAAARPQAVQALIVQNANAYDEGITPVVRDVVLRIYRNRNPETEAALRRFFELEVTKKQYYDGVRDASLISPDAWQHAQWGLDRPGNKEIQFALHANYGSNPERYQEWHAYFRRHQPPTLIVWGVGDQVFSVDGARAYMKDLQDCELHLLDTGHFALETHAAEIAMYMRSFLNGHLGRAAAG